MEDQITIELDLRRYVRALVRASGWIILASILGATLAALAPLRRPASYVATSSVFLRPTRSQVTLDERFVTNEAIDAAARRRGLLGLAKSPTIEAQIPPDILAQLAPDDYTVGDLADSNIKIAADGDLMIITARQPTADQARMLADAWANTLVSYVNTLYSNTGIAVEGTEQERDAAQRYAASQQAYERFLGESRVDELDQSIAAINSVFTETLKADQARQSAYLGRAQHLDLVLRDAESLRGQLAAGQPVDLGAVLASLSLRAQASGGAQLPVQLQFDQSAALGEDQVATVGSLDALIVALREQITAARAAAAEIAVAIAKDAAAPNSSLTAVERAEYNTQLLDLRSRREMEEGKRRVLEQERDVAFEALQVVRRKVAEQQVAAVQPDAEVRLASVVPLPAKLSRPNILLWMIAGGFAGLLLGIALALLIEIFGMPQIIPQRGGRKRSSNFPTSG